MVHGSDVETGNNSQMARSVMMIIITIAIALIEEQKTFTFKIFFFWKGYGSFPFLLLHFLKFLVYILLWTGVNI